MAVEITPGKSEEELKCLIALEGETLVWPLRVAINHDKGSVRFFNDWAQFMDWYRTFQ